jgi:hypothetical protein
MPRGEGQALVLDGVVNGRLDVHDDGFGAWSSESWRAERGWHARRLPVGLAGMSTEITVNTE